jgi:hypothetical protein
MKKQLLPFLAFVSWIGIQNCKQPTGQVASDDSTLQAVQKGNQAYLWVSVPNSKPYLQCWYYSSVPHDKNDNPNIEAYTKRIFNFSENLNGGKAVHRDILYSSLSKRVHSKNELVKQKNKGIMLIYGDLLTQMSESRAINLQDCQMNENSFAFIGSTKGSWDSFQARCRVETFNYIHLAQATNQVQPKELLESDWVALDALRFAIADTQPTSEVCSKPVY